MVEGREDVPSVCDAAVTYCSLSRPPCVFAYIQLTLSSKRNSEYFDPCQEAATRSLKCMHRNGGDRDMCSDYFQCVSSLLTRHDTLLDR